MNKIKLMIIDIGLDFSGAEKVLQYYLADNSKIEPFIVTIYNGIGTSEFERIYGCNRVFCLNVNYSKNELRFFPKITQLKVLNSLLEMEELLLPDIVYVNNTLEIAICKEYVKKTQKPCVGHIHDMKTSFGTFIKIYEVKSASKYFRALFTVSNACKKSWGLNNMEVVYNGVPNTFYSNSSNKIRNRELSIGFVGMASKRKGIDLLPDVVKNIMPNVRWKIAYNLVEPACQKYLDLLKSYQNVDIFKNLNIDEIIDFYNSIDVLIIPSRADPLPTVAIEAMAQGVMVLGSNVGGIPELLGGNEFLFKTVSSTDICKKLNEIMTLDEADFKERRDKQMKRAKLLFNQEVKREILNDTFLDFVNSKKD